MESFFDQVKALQGKNATVLCMGLDPRPHFISAEDREAQNPLAAWGERMLRETADYLCCVKPNIAFYEAQGSYGWQALKQTIAVAHEIGLPVLLDAKRGDIGSTAEAYAVAAFHELQADAITLSPYLGRDSIDPFLRTPGRGLFVLCHTSNPSAHEFQSLEINGRLLYEVLAQRATQWSERVGLVVGATYPHAIERVREVAPDAWLLLPGVGAQGADEKAALAAARDNIIVPVSRGIIAQESPRLAAKSLRDKLNKARDRAKRAPDLPDLPDLSPLQQRLTEELVAINALKFGDFTLASGKQSPIYIDLRLLASHPRTLSLAARTYTELLTSGELDYDLIAPLPYAALPIGTAVSLQTGDPLIYPRKESKQYGTKRQIEGQFNPGQRALLLDDVISTSRSKIKATQTLRDAGLQVQDLVVLIDRSGGKADDQLAAHEVSLHPVMTIEAMLAHLVSRGIISHEQQAEVERFLREE
ncbi:MAG: orotidine-5'-phosphate decarboxylase [Ardenticatenaceae bacterium]